MHPTAKGTIDSYKASSIRTAKDQYEKGNLNWNKVKDWRTFYDRDGEHHSYAYPVGSSFDFYIMDSYGIDTLFEIFADLPKTKNVDVSIRNVLHKEPKEIEVEWIQYLLSYDLAEIFPPEVTVIYPEFGQTDVPIDIKEVYIEFDQPMSAVICISSICENGICYKNAYWETDRRLVARVIPRLLPNYDYEIYLGNTRGCNLTAETGEKFPRTLWNFSTAGYDVTKK